jgi:hypothetical protein
LPPQQTKYTKASSLKQIYLFAPYACKRICLLVCFFLIKTKTNIGVILVNSKPKQYAVLTADIVHSTKLSSADYTKVMTTLKNRLEAHEEKYECKFEIFRGDSFQVLYQNIDEAMSSALSLRLFLQSGIECSAVKLTQSLALGEVESRTNSISSSLGEAFILSGRALDDASRGDMLLSFGEDFSSTDLSVSTLFLRHLLNGLTEKQSEVLYYYIDFDFPEQQVIADHMKMTRQNVATHLKRSGAELVKAYLLGYQEICLGKTQ